MKSSSTKTSSFMILMLVWTSVSLAAQKAAPDPGNTVSYYTTAPLFNPYPKVTDKKPWNVRNFGPVGIGINLIRPGFTMEIANVEKGSPAEAGEGQIRLKIKDLGEVVVTIPVMGAYSATWPLNCPKSDKIVRNLADLLSKAVLMDPHTKAVMTNGARTVKTRLTNWLNKQKNKSASGHER